jgi:ribosome-binding protein aMBF1 (putative translation factor)
MSTANTVRAEMARKGLKINAVAQKLGVSRVSLHRWLASDKIPIPYLLMLEKLLGIKLVDQDWSGADEK